MSSTFIEECSKRIKSRDIKVVSFDFFDTLMSRRSPFPVDVFLDLGRRLIEEDLIATPVLPKRFQQLRIRAEARAREAGASKEVGILEIYAQFPDGFFTAPLGRIVEVELEAESASLFRIEHMFSMVKLAHQRGKQVVVVSDTYLSADHLKQLWGSCEVPVKFFTSSEARTGKYDRLFEVVTKRVRCKFSQILHVGDNYVADCEVPSRLGMAALHIPHGSSRFWNLFHTEAKPNLHDSTRLAGNRGDLGITSLRGKVVQFYPIDESDVPTLQKYGAEVLGPPLALFADWVCSFASQKNISLAIPLMREGYLIGKLLSDRDPELTVRPAYFSRRQLLQACLIDPDAEALRSLRFANLTASVRDYLGLVMLLPEEVPQLRQMLEMSVQAEEMFAQTLECILSSPENLHTIASRARELRLGVVSQLKTITDLLDTEQKRQVLLSDVGWNATIQRMLQKISDEESLGLSFVGLYMMTTPAVNDLMFDGVRAYGLYVDGGFSESDFLALSRTLEIFEQSCAPSHGSSVGFDLNSSTPLLAGDTIPAHQRNDIGDIQEGVLLFHDLYVKHRVPLSYGEIQRYAQPAINILRRAMLCPSTREVEFFQRWVHDDNLASGRTHPILGTVHERKHLKYKTVNQILSTPMDRLYWPGGAIALHAPEIQEVLSLAVAAQLPPSVVDRNTGVSMELYVSSQNGATDAVQHQPILQNAAGKSFVEFDVSVCNANALRWTPCAKAFELKIDSVTITGTSSAGLSQQKHLSGAEFSLFARSMGMQQVSMSVWRGRGPGCAFDVADIFSLGLPPVGRVRIQICFSLALLESDDLQPAPAETEGPHDFYAGELVDASGQVFFDHINDQRFERLPKDVSIETQHLNLEGWMVDLSGPGNEGEVYVRLTSAIGTTEFIPMQKAERPDVAEHFGRQDLLNCGFVLSSHQLPRGKFGLSIVRKSSDKFLVSKLNLPLRVGSATTLEYRA